METAEHELEILENIYKHKEQIHQRDLARIAGLSLGMTEKKKTDVFYLYSESYIPDESMEHAGFLQQLMQPGG